MTRTHAAFLLCLVIAAMPAMGGEPEHDASHAHGEDDDILSYVLLDQFEFRNGDRERALAWDVKGWMGTDINRLWLRSDGAMVSGHAESASVEVLYGRSVSTWWDVVAGMRREVGPGDSQSFAAFGLQGLAPQRVDIAVTAYVGNHGHTAARLTAGYELLLTNRLVLQPHVELDAYGKTDIARERGSGISRFHAGLRLRYEVTRQFAPYIGVTWERAIGKTADLTTGGGSELRGVAGVRAWF
jgi:copper resistance protein B